MHRRILEGLYRESRTIYIQVEKHTIYDTSSLRCSLHLEKLCPSFAGTLLCLHVTPKWYMLMHKMETLVYSRMTVSLYMQ